MPQEFGKIPDYKTPRVKVPRKACSSKTNNLGRRYRYLGRRSSHLGHKPNDLEHGGLSCKYVSLGYKGFRNESKCIGGRLRGG